VGAGHRQRDRKVDFVIVGLLVAALALYQVSRERPDESA
jgi:hypothetical protein